MNIADPNVLLVESVARAMGPLCKEVVFVGGCATGLLLTDPAAPLTRPTKDVDVIAEVTSYSDYRVLGRNLKEAGFSPDTSPDAPICRGTIGELRLDVMPTSEDVLGFTNSWYREAARSAKLIRLPGGTEIRLIIAPLFVAAKIEAFHGRGHGDYIGSHDMEDIITLVDGRPELPGEVLAYSEPELVKFISEEIEDLLGTPAFFQAISGFLRPDEASQARVPTIIARLRQIAGI